MMTRYCPNCGTEVDETAVFCPTCGQPIDQAMETEMPAAPAWPEPPRAAEPPESQSPTPQPVEPDAARWSDEPAPTDVPAAPRDEPPARAEAPAATPPPAIPAPADPAAGQGPAANLPVTVPLTLSAWLIGGGAALGALGALIGLFDGFVSPVELVLLVALLGIAATVFFSSSLPEIPQLRLATLAIALVGFGVALDRLGFGGSGIAELLLFLGTAAAAIGAIMLELGRDQPMGVAR
jgi:zinc ribbon protein